MKANNNFRKLYSKFVDNSKFKIDKDSHVFIDEVFSKATEAGQSRVIPDFELALPIFQKYDRYYLPFNKCSLFMEASPDYSAALITIEDSLEHKLNSVRKFSIVNTDVMIVGKFILGREESDFIKVIGGLGTFNTVLTDKVGCEMVLTVDEVHYKYGNKVQQLSKRKGYLELEVGRRQLSDLVNGLSIEILNTLVFFARFLVDRKRFVVEETPSVKKKNGTVKVKPAESLFKIMKVGDIRKVIKSTDSGASTRKLKVGFEKRQHTRLLSNDCFTHKKGETIIIPACWVGPTDYFDPSSNKLFKVRLDIE